MNDFELKVALMKAELDDLRSRQNWIIRFLVVIMIALIAVLTKGMLG